MIKKFNDFAQTKAITDNTQLPKGAYIMTIKSAEVNENSVGQYVQMSLDVAEGEHAGHFLNDYNSQTSEDKKWHCNYFLNVPKDDGSEKDNWTKRKFKTFTDALMESNPGYAFDWDEQKFIGKKVGALFNEQEYRKNDGTVGSSTAIARVITIEAVRTGNYKMPADKKLKEANGPISTDTSFINVPDGAEEEIPF